VFVKINWAGWSKEGFGIFLLWLLHAEDMDVEEVFGKVQPLRLVMNTPMFP
jgi:hypothetical protein